MESIDKILKSIDDATNELESIDANESLSSEEKEELIKKNLNQFKQYEEMMRTITGKTNKMIRKKKKTSKYQLATAIGKYKSFTMKILKLEDSILIESVTDDMYNIIDELKSFDDEYKQRRLSELYSSTFRNTFNTYKKTVIDMVDELKSDEKDYVQAIQEFYGAYFGMVIKTVTEKYNEEIEKLQKDREKKAVESVVNNVNPDMASSSQLAKEINEGAADV